MRVRPHIWIVNLVILFAILGACPIWYEAKACAAELKPTRQQVQTLVHRHLSQRADYQPGDLLCLNDVEPILNLLIDNGLKVTSDHEELYDSILRNNDSLVRSLQTSAGRAFMRKVASLPDAYDRLERLSWLPAGRELLARLIADPEGAKAFAAMLTPEGLKAVERKFADDPRGRNFSLPTGHVHTADDLAIRLEQIINAQTAK